MTSKAFYGGVLVDQIMQACHWKAHNTFTNFYLKDLTWSDNDNNMYLGPVVAAQQVLLSVYIVYYVLRTYQGCHKSHVRWLKIMRIPSLGLVFLSWISPKGLTLHK